MRLNLMLVAVHVCAHLLLHITSLHCSFLSPLLPPPNIHAHVRTPPSPHTCTRAHTPPPPPHTHTHKHTTKTEKGIKETFSHAKPARPSLLNRLMFAHLLVYVWFRMTRLFSSATGFCHKCPTRRELGSRPM
jgi:hypothetical protein